LKPLVKENEVPIKDISDSDDDFDFGGAEIENDR